MKVLNTIFATICIPINLLLMILGHAYLWAGIVIVILIFFNKKMPKKTWLILIIITIITIIGSLPSISPPMSKSKKNQIYSYLNDKYEGTFKIKKQSFSLKYSYDFCLHGTWISPCFGFKMFNWDDQVVFLVDEKNIDFSLQIKSTGFNKFEILKDDYLGSLKQNKTINFMKNKLIPVLRKYSITNVKHDGWIYVYIMTESIDKAIEKQKWEEIKKETEYYSKYSDISVIVRYYKKEPYYDNEIADYYMKRNEWDYYFK